MYMPVNMLYSFPVLFQHTHSYNKRQQQIVLHKIVYATCSVTKSVHGKTRVSEIVTQHNFTNEDAEFFLPTIFLNLCMEAVMCISDRCSSLSG